MQCYCPNPNCDWNKTANLPKDKRWYGFHGFYTSSQHGKIPRYICRKCHTTFSLRTYSDKWHLRYDNYDILELGTKWLKGESVSKLSQEYGISQNAIKVRLKRLTMPNSFHKFL